MVNIQNTKVSLGRETVFVVTSTQKKKSPVVLVRDLDFQALWELTSDIITTNWNVGSGRRLAFHAMDALLMVLVQLKQGTTYKTLARVFGMTSDTFSWLVDGFALNCVSPILDNFIVKDPMLAYRERGEYFQHFRLAIKAIDVTFQKAFAQGEDYQTKKYQFSGKHKAYR